MILVKNETNLSRYRQGNEIADCLVCSVCGVLVGVCYEEHGHLYATVNSKTVGNSTDFGAEAVVSPRTLNDQEKIQRWKNAWFSDVSIKKVEVAHAP